MTTARTPNSRSLGEHRAAGVAKYHETKLKTEIAKHRPLFYKAWKKHCLDEYVVTDINYNTGVVTGVNRRGELTIVRILDDEANYLLSEFLLKDKWSIACELQQRLFDGNFYSTILNHADITLKNLKAMEANPWVLEAKRFTHSVLELNAKVGHKPPTLVFNSSADHLYSTTPWSTSWTGVVFEGIHANTVSGLIRGYEAIKACQDNGQLVEYYFTSRPIKTLRLAKQAPSFRMHGRVGGKQHILHSARVNNVQEIYQHFKDVDRLAVTALDVEPYTADDIRYCYLWKT